MRPSPIAPILNFTNFSISSICVSVGLNKSTPVAAHLPGRHRPHPSYLAPVLTSSLMPADSPAKNRSKYSSYWTHMRKCQAPPLVFVIEPHRLPLHLPLALILFSFSKSKNSSIIILLHKCMYADTIYHKYLGKSTISQKLHNGEKRRVWQKMKTPEISMISRVLSWLPTQLLIQFGETAWGKMLVWILNKPIIDIQQNYPRGI